jgi:hypothetical protein
MASRFGTAMYALGNVIFGLNALFWIAAFWYPEPRLTEALVPIFVIGGPFWLVGYLCRYVLKGTGNA